MKEPGTPAAESAHAHTYSPLLSPLELPGIYQNLSGQKLCVSYTVIPGSTIRKPPIDRKNDMGSDKRTDETPARWEPASAVGPKHAANKEEIYLEAEILKSSPSNFSRYHAKNVRHYSCIQIRLQTLLCFLQGLLRCSRPYYVRK